MNDFQSLPLDLGVKMSHPDGATGVVVDVFTKYSFINGREVAYSVYVVQMTACAISNTAKRWAQLGWEVRS